MTARVTGSGSGPCRSVSVRVFTLLELMVAMVVFTLVAAGLFAFGREVAKSWGRMHREQQRFAALMALDRALDNMLTNIVPFTWHDEEGRPLPAFAGEGDRVRFATRHSLSNLNDGAIRFVALFVNEDDQLLAVYQQRPYLDWDEFREFAQVSVLADDVESVEFTYVDEIKDQGLSWESEWDPEREAMPLGIMMAVQWRDGRVESWLRRTAGSGLRESWGRWEARTEM